MENSPTEQGTNVQFICQILITIVFVIGAGANAVALWVLYRSSNGRNSKHVLMLKCLATNDILAQFGMLILMKIKMYHMIPVYWQCVLYVCLRAFGIGSGCVACIMAMERWMALTKPFIYQQLVTYKFVRKVLAVLWLSAVMLTYMPFFGIGIYYKDDKCSRYREATETADVAYAYTYLVFGSVLIAVIVCCNISIIIELWKIGHSQSLFVRRYNRTTVHHNFSTPEEIAFAKLMAVVCVIFIVCWMPQLISIPLARLIPKSKFYDVFGKVADLLMCAYFALNPFIYVLHRRSTKPCKLACNSCNCSKLATGRSRSISTNGTTAITTDF